MGPNNNTRWKQNKQNIQAKILLKFGHKKYEIKNWFFEKFQIKRLVRTCVWTSTNNHTRLGPLSLSQVSDENLLTVRTWREGRRHKGLFVAVLGPWNLGDKTYIGWRVKVPSDELCRCNLVILLSFILFYFIFVLCVKRPTNKPIRVYFLCVLIPMLYLCEMNEFFWLLVPCFWPMRESEDHNFFLLSFFFKKKKR